MPFTQIIFFGQFVVQKVTYIREIFKDVPLYFFHRLLLWTLALNPVNQIIIKRKRYDQPNLLVANSFAKKRKADPQIENINKLAKMQVNEQTHTG